jgi:hypothetical protein
MFQGNKNLYQRQVSRKRIMVWSTKIHENGPRIHQLLSIGSKALVTRGSHLHILREIVYSWKLIYKFI